MDELIKALDRPHPYDAVVQLYLTLANHIVLMALAALAVWLWWGALRRPRVYHPRAIRLVLFPLALGGVVWHITYWDLLIYRIAWANAPTLKVAKALDTSAWSNWLTIVTAICLVLAGATLMQLQDRIRSDLPAPGSRGIQLRWAQHLPRSEYLAGGIALLFLVANMTYHDRDAIDRWMGSIGLVVLGLGMLRELNRWRIEAAGMIPALAILVYGVAQLFGELSPLSMSFIALICKVLMLSIMAFLSIVPEVARVQKEAETRLDEDRAGYRSKTEHVQHRVRNAMAKVGAAVGELEDRDVEEQRIPLAAIRSQLGIVEDVLVRIEIEAPLDRGQPLDTIEAIFARTRDQLDGFRGARVVIGPIEPAGVQVPRNPTIDAIRAVVENAAQEGARTIHLSARREGACWLIEVANDGPPLSPEARQALFRRHRGGFWAARWLLTHLGGGIELVHSEAHETRFRLVVPDRVGGHGG